MQTKPSPEVEVAVIGDSHAEQLFLGLAEAIPHKNIAYYIQDGSPFLSRREFSEILDAVEKSDSIKHIVISLYWNGRNGEIPGGSTLDKELIRTIDKIGVNGKEVILVADIPDYPFTPDRCAGKRWLATKNPQCEIKRDVLSQQYSQQVELLNRVVQARPHVTLVETTNYFCEGDACSMVRGGRVMYRDKVHLTIGGSIYLGDRLMKDHASLFD